MSRVEVCYVSSMDGSRNKTIFRKTRKNDVKEISLSLFVVANIDDEFPPKPLPTGHAAVVTYLEKLVEDRRGCVVYWREPCRYGELRWLAARVLACEYAYQGIEKPIMLENVVQPITLGDGRGLLELTKIDQLIEQGLLPTKTEIIKPQDYAYCCSKEAVEEIKRNQDNNE